MEEIFILLVMISMIIWMLKERVDEEYQKPDIWYKKCVEAICKMGFFSSDRAIQTYANDIWDLKPLEVPKPSITKSGHFVSTGDLKDLDKK